MIDGKHAVVTGGGRGIGLAIANALAAAGARVSVVSRSVHEHQAFACHTADVTNEEQVARAFDGCRKSNGPIDILINNSGIAESAPLIRTGLAMWDRIIATNLTGTFLCSRNAVEDMMIANWGRIVNVASIAGLYGAAYVSAYSASKHGVVGFTRSIAMEFSKTRITANAICPGYTETDMMRRAMDNVTRITGASDDEARAALAKQSPEGRIATPEEVAQGALDLINSDRNGDCLIIPGNIYA
jgi:NAD(P)-dependent dehydrogenase (short-subunit alcohol dehydrogenase family)